MDVSNKVIDTSFKCPLPMLLIVQNYESGDLRPLLRPAVCILTLQRFY